LKKNNSNKPIKTINEIASKTISAILNSAQKFIWKKRLLYVNSTLGLLTLVAFSLNGQNAKPVNFHHAKVLETNLFETNGLISFLPMDIFTMPNTLMNIWIDEPIPLEMYTQEELDIQQHINGKETRIITYAPIGKEKAWLNIDYEEITPYTWKWVKFDLFKENGTISRIIIRRPNWWLKKNNADKIGNQVVLFLPEMGINGTAIVKKITPNQLDTRLWDEQRKGDYINRPITGKFEHESDDVWNYYFQGLEEPIGTTSTHPFWSEDRQDWIPVGNLKIGEKIKAKKLITKLAKKHKIEGRQKVYNLEVYREHNFLVAKEGLLVHNSCVDANKIHAKLKEKIELGRWKDPGYHAHFDDDIVLDIIDDYDEVYASTARKGNLIYRKGTDIVVVGGSGNQKNKVITGYGPSGIKGESGARALGGDPSDPGDPITHNMIINGQIPNGTGGFIAPAIPVQLY